LTPGGGAVAPRATAQSNGSEAMTASGLAMIEFIRFPHDPRLERPTGDVPRRSLATDGETYFLETKVTSQARKTAVLLRRHRLRGALAGVDQDSTRTFPFSRLDSRLPLQHHPPKKKVLWQISNHSRL